MINDRLKANYPIPEHSYVCAFLLIFQAKSGRGLTIDDFLKKEKKEGRKKRVSYSFIVGIVSISSIYRLRSASFLLSNSSRRVYRYKRRARASIQLYPCVASLRKNSYEEESFVMRKLEISIRHFFHLFTILPSLPGENRIIPLRNCRRWTR